MSFLLATADSFVPKYSNQGMSEVIDAYINGRKIQDSQLLTKKDAQGDIMLMTNKIPNNLQGLLTVIIYDLDAPFPPPNNGNSPMLHFLAVNGKGPIFTSDSVLAAYISPNPPVNDPTVTHRYYIRLYSQPKTIKADPVNSRKNFDLDTFIKSNSLKLIDTLVFDVSPEQIGPIGQYIDPNDSKAKYCRCVVHVASKGSASNPYAVCAHSVGTSTKDCSNVIDYSQFTQQELAGYLKFKGSAGTPQAIRDFLASKSDK